MKDLLLQRVQELRQATQNSANNHNALIGRLAEAEVLLDACLKKEQEMKVIEEVKEPQDHIPE